MQDISVPGILVLVALLQLKHAVCDGPLQTLWMIREKGHYGKPGGLAHAGIHGAGSLLVLLVFGMAALPAFALAAAETVIHYHIDFAKETLARRNDWTHDQSAFWWALMADQMFHQFTYLAMAFAVTAI